MMRRLWIIFILCFPVPLSANHIVGGEIEFITIRPGQYIINLIQYFDDLNPINVGPPTLEQTATVSIFRNSKINGEWDPNVVSSHLLRWVNRISVPYTNEECALESLETSRVLWSDTIELDPEEYSNPEGYYIAWERCCRNAGVVNILNPLQTGMKYVTEIPPLWKNGGPYINSSPILFNPLSDYGCVGQLYYTEFTGTDPDGDSLVYSLVSPINSSAFEALPITQSKPNFPVRFIESQGFSPQAQILGSPNLGINPRGLLTVNPSATGLYVFSVLVEEFRNKEKIGQVQRDFQMLVVDGCEPPDPPVVGIKIPGNVNFQPETDTLRYMLTEDKCFDFVVTNVTPGETISLRAEGVNFAGNIDEIFEFNQTLIGQNQDTLLLEVCAPGCPPYNDRPFVVDLIAGDDACPLPQLDSLRLTIDVEAPPNSFPDVTPEDFALVVDENQLFKVRITGQDIDDDMMGITYFIPNVLDPEEFGFDLNIVTSEEGLLEADLSWNTNCEEISFNGKQQFPVSVIIDDVDSCLFENPDPLEIDLSLASFNTNPIVTIEDFSVNRIDIPPNAPIAFDVAVTDADGDLVNLRMAGQDFNPAAFGATFDPVSGEGVASSRFEWFVDCNLMDPEGENSFTFNFIGDDEDPCQLPNFDTLSFTINVQLPVNEAPILGSIPDFQLEINELFTTDITATDPNSGDVITLKFLDGFRLPKSRSLSFPPASGNVSVTSTLSWQPECSLLGGSASRTYDLLFVVVDNGCPISKFDTTKVTFEIVETRSRFDRFLPPNVFTPNDDGINDTFSLTNSSDPAANLPPDNCDDSFQYITIHNRAGETVFHSEKRDFSWSGLDNESGVYFYLVKYSKTEYKNFIQLLR